MIIEIDGIYYAYLSLSQSPVLVLEYHEDPMQCVIECPYCGHLTTVGETRMLCGFVGCDNCYFGKDGLMETTMYYKEHCREEYVNSAFYRRGYKNWRVK